MTTRTNICLAILIMAGLLAGCGSGHGTQLEDSTRAAAPQGLRLLPGSPADENSPVRISTEQHAVPDGLRIDIRVEDASELHGLYFSYDYDATQLSPTGVEDAGLLGAVSDNLLLSILDRPGHLEAGLLQVRSQARSGFSGSGILASLYFAEQPCPAVPRSSSQAPQNEASRPQLNFTPGIPPLTQDSFSWYYSCTGDYSQDGLVAISDLTPLGIHFGEGGGFAMELEQSQIDGDGNGELTIADLTPIGINFGSSVNAFNVYMSADSADYPLTPQAGNGNAQLVQSLSLADMQRNPGERGRFEIFLPAVQNQVYFWLRATDGASEGLPSNIVAALPGPLAPLVQLEADSLSGTAPLTVNLNAIASDPDGSIVNYAFDLDGDGSFETDNGPLPATGTVFNQPGNYTVAVQVTDDDGLSTSDSLVINVGSLGNQPPLAVLKAKRSQGYYPYDSELDLSGCSDPDGTVQSIELDIDGDGAADFTPALGTQQFSLVLPGKGNYELKLTVTDDDGDSSVALLPVAVQKRQWAQRTVRTVEAIKYTGALSIASLPTGLLLYKTQVPCIAAGYTTYTDGNQVSYFKAYNSTGDKWLAPHLLGSPYGLGWIDMIVQGARPMVGYMSQVTAQLPLNTQVRLADNSLGEHWSFPAFPFGGDCIPYMSMARHKGLPVVAMMPAVNPSQLWLYGDSSQSGDTGWHYSRKILDIGQSCTFDMADTPTDCGIAIMTFSNSDASGDLYYSTPVTDSLDSWPQQPEVVARDCGSGLFFPSLAFLDGTPMIAWMDGFNGQIMLSVALDEDATQWSTSVVTPVQYWEAGGRMFRLLACDGLPMLLYFQNTANTHELYAISALDREGTAWAEPARISTDAGGYLDACMAGRDPLVCCWSADDSSVEFLRQVPLF